MGLPLLISSVLLQENGIPTMSAAGNDYIGVGMLAGNVPEPPLGSVDHARRCRPLLTVTLPFTTIKLSAAADEREVFKYTLQSFWVFEQGLLSKAWEKSFTTREISQDAESGEEEEGRGCRFLDDPPLSELSDAMANGLQDHLIACERLEEAVDRYEHSSGSTTFFSCEAKPREYNGDLGTHLIPTPPLCLVLCECGMARFRSSSHRIFRYARSTMYRARYT